MVEESSSSKMDLSIKHDWYQTDTAVVITVLRKNLKEDQLKVTFSESEVSVSISVPEFEEWHRCFNLTYKIIPEQSSYKLSPSKVEIKLKKAESLRWETLEGTPSYENIKAIPQGSTPNLNQILSYPTSKKGVDWNKLEVQIKKEEEEAPLEGEDSLNRLFQSIYGKGGDDVRRAMNKSFSESGGTVLSTNWKEVSQKKVDVKPPDGVEYKKWDS